MLILKRGCVQTEGLRVAVRPEQVNYAAETVYEYKNVEDGRIVKTQEDVVEIKLFSGATIAVADPDRQVLDSIEVAVRLGI